MCSRKPSSRPDPLKECGISTPRSSGMGNIGGGGARLRKRRSFDHIVRKDAMRAVEAEMEMEGGGKVQHSKE